MRAFFAGSFDPITNGHLDLISRVVPRVESLVVAVAINPDKRPVFSVEERVAMLREVCAPWPTVRVRAFTGLVVDAAREEGADVLIRGIRTGEDAVREIQRAQTNRALAGLETLLLPADPALAFVSSTLVREVARFGGEVTAFVPALVAERLRRALQP